MKIRGKINLLVSVMAGAALLIGATALYAVNQYDSQLQKYERASTRAYLGERLNRYVTAVVMEGRGIYNSPDIKAAKGFSDGLTADLVEIDKVLAKWAPLVPERQNAVFAGLIAKSKAFNTFRTETVRLLLTDGPEAANKQGNNEDNRANRKAFQADIDAVVQADTQELSAVNADIESFRDMIFWVVLAVTGFGIAAGVGFGLYIGTNHLSRPINKVTDAIKDVANGDFNVDVPYVGRADEIGDMAGAVEVFKQNGLAVK
ncbi:MAG: HAMP domain-containing protein, partial [Rhizobium sp.]